MKKIIFIMTAMITSSAFAQSMQDQIDEMQQQQQAADYQRQVDEAGRQAQAEHDAWRAQVQERQQQQDMQYQMDTTPPYAGGY